MAVVGWVYRRRGAGAGVTALAGVNVVLLAVLVGLWAPTLSRPNIRDISAAVVSKYGEGPFALVGKEDLPMVFNMRRVLPVVRTEAEIADLAARQPDVVVIEAVGANKKPRGAVVEEARFRDGETVYRVGRIGRTEAPAGAAAPVRSSGDGE